MKVNSSDKQVIDVKKLYTGLCDMKVIAVNPSKEELQKIYPNSDREPEYLVKDDEGNTTFRIHIYLKNEEHNIIEPVVFFLKNKTIDKDNGVRLINNKGQTYWAKKDDDGKVVETHDWFDNEGARPHFIGEDKLIMFIKKWGNIASKDPCYIDKPAEMIEKGSTQLFKDLVKQIPENKVKVLLGVKDGQYQGVYNNYFERPYITSVKEWEKKLSSGYDDFTNHDYQNSLVFKVYDPTKVTKDVAEMEDKDNTDKDDLPWN